MDGTGRVTLRNKVALRQIVPYGVSVPVDGGLKLDRSSGSSPRVPMVSHSVPVSQDVPRVPKTPGGLVVPETTCAMPHVILQGLPNRIEVSELSIEPDTAGTVPRRSSCVRKEPDRMTY